MTTARQDRHRKSVFCGMNRATAPVIESLEGRMLLSAGMMNPRSHILMDVTPHGGHHAVSAAPAQGFLPPASSFLEQPAGIIRIGGGGNTPAQIRHLYGLDALDAVNPNFPLYLNNGDGQTIVVVGSYAPQINDIPMGRKSNINLFSTQYGLQTTLGGVFEDPLPGAFNPLLPVGPNNLFDSQGAIESTMQLEWAHAMAPFANLVLVEVASTNGVIAPSDLQAGIQEGINDLQITSPNAFNNIAPGGVVTMSLATVGENLAITNQFDTLFSQAAAADVSFIAPTGDYGSTLSMPATSPFVTAVGGTQYNIDATGTRLSEIASLQSGGGQSFLEPLPAFQQGIRIGKKALPSRAIPDISLASITRGIGVDVYYDPTNDNTAPNKHYTEEGTSVSAPIFAGMVADANEMRATFGEAPIGEQLNAKLYEGFKLLPSLNFTDITQGNNILHPALRGFDLATGMGAPKAAGLIPFLAGTIGNLAANVKFSGSFNTPFNSPPVLVTQFTSTGGVASVGSQFVGLTLPLVSSSPLTSNAVVTFTAITRNPDNSILGFGTAVVNFTTVDPVSGLRTMTSATFPVEITGRISGKSASPRITAQVFTINGNGTRIPQGVRSAFQGNVST